MTKNDRSSPLQDTSQQGGEVDVLALPRPDFLAHLYGFMEKIGQPIQKLPHLGYQELDLYQLFHIVIRHGGMDEVTSKQAWKTVYQELGIPTMSTSASYNTRTNYKKFLYLYELEYCNFNNGPRPVDKEPRFKVGQYVRIESSVLEGQIFYAQISKYRWRNNTNMYYVHYNGWSTSHDEWMPEDVLDNLKPSEAVSPADLVNPNPSRSSKSNHIIVGDSATAEKHQHLHYMMKQPVRINHSANPMSSPTVLRPVLSPAGRSANATYQPIHRQQSVSPNWEFIRHELMQVEDEISKRKHHNFTTLDPDDSDEDCPSLNEKDKESLQTRKRPLGQFNLHLAGLEMPVGYNPDLFRKLLEKVNNDKRKTKDIDATTLEKPITATTTTRTTRKTTNATPSKEPSPILTAKSNVDTAFLDDRSLEQIAASISQIESQMAQIEEQLRIRAGGKIEEMDEHQQLSTSNESSAQTSSGSSDTEEPAPKAQTITRRKRIT